MCGLLAVFGPFDRLEVRKFRFAISAVSHRGPDFLGDLETENAYLAHTRLSILGLDEQSNQPMRRDNMVLVFNGEIFNYIEIRLELAKLGCQFITTSDTEVVLQAYLQWGEGCFEKFNGMWALVLLDEENNQLIVSRDRFGQKPLFYTNHKGRWVFASEAHQLANIIDAEPRLTSVQAFLKEGDFSNRGATFFENIFSFPKAHFCRISLSGDVKVGRYWDYPAGKPLTTCIEDFEKFQELLSDSIYIRQRSDVPCSMLLSGGIDSSAIANIAASNPLESTTELTAFTFSSQDAEDETVYAKEIAQSLGIPISIRSRLLDFLEFRQRLSRLVFNMGRGHSSPAIVSVDLLYDAVHKSGFKVALDGQGADELLCGYKNHFLISSLLYTRDCQISLAMKSIRAMGEFGYKQATLSFLRNALPGKLRKYGRHLYGHEKYFKAMDSSTDTPPPINIIPKSGLSDDMLNRFLIKRHDLGLENLLYYGDIVAMRNSVENRSPFIDHRLVDFAFSRDQGLKVHGDLDKYALRTTQFYKKHQKVLERKKVGFASRISNKFKGLMLSEIRCSPIISWPIFSEEIKRALMDNKLMDKKYETFLFRVYQVHLWSEHFS